MNWEHINNKATQTAFGALLQRIQQEDYSIKREVIFYARSVTEYLLTLHAICAETDDVAYDSRLLMF